MNSLRAAALALLAGAAACSDSEDAAAPPVTADEQRALAEARKMILADELEPEPATKETPTP